MKEEKDLYLKGPITTTHTFYSVEEEEEFLNNAEIEQIAIFRRYLIFLLRGEILSSDQFEIAMKNLSEKAQKKGIFFTKPFHKLD